MRNTDFQAVTPSVAPRPLLRTLARMGMVLCLAGRANAQATNYGIAARADAAQRMIVLGIEQAIASLPPTAGQSLVYEFDLGSDTYVASKRLGPTALRSTQTLGEGRFSLRFSTSYFELSDRFIGPAEYRVTGPFPTEQLQRLQEQGIAVKPDAGLLTRLGLQADAKVTLFNFSGGFGLTPDVDLTINLPVVITDASGSEIFLENKSTSPGRIDSYPADFTDTSLVLTDPCPPPRLPGSCLIDERLADERPGAQKVGYGRDRFQDRGVSFPDGTNAGLGRVSLGARLRYKINEQLRFAFHPEIFLPSPNEDELAGSNSTALLPRAVGEYKLTNWAHLHADLGYAYDFDSDELSRFVWSAGSSFSMTNATFDVGIGGAEYDQGLQWTPTTATFLDSKGHTNAITTASSTQLGSSFVDFLGGVKIRLLAQLVMSGAVNVPLNDQGFRPAAAGTVAFEYRL